MQPVPISEVAKQFGLRSSALRYYERIGLLPAATISGGRRHYDATILNRISIIQRARAAGFSLAEIRELFQGYAAAVPASRRWQELTRRKQAQLEDAARKIRDMQGLLEKMSGCECETLDACGGLMRSRRKDCSR